MVTVNFTKPVVTDLRADVLSYIRDYQEGQAKLFDGDTLTSPPTGAIRYSSSNVRFEKWSGAAWAELPLTSFGAGATITGGASLSLQLSNSSATPWALDLRRSDSAASTRVRNDGGKWSFEHRPVFAGNTPLDSGNYNTYAPTLTGTGASGTWGISISGTAATASAVAWAGITGAPAITGLTATLTATSSAVAQRDGNADLSARYFYSTASNNENPTISQFMVTNGTDGYMRKASVATVASAVSSAVTPTWSNISGKPTTLSSFTTNIFGAATVGDGQNWNSLLTNGFSNYMPTGNDTNGPGGAHYYHPLNIEYATKDASGNVTQLAIPYGANVDNIFIRGRYSGTWTAWNKVWTANNDGANSLLDADLLDGQEGAYYTSASNLSSGTLAAARLSGAAAYDISAAVANTFAVGYRDIPNRGSGLSRGECLSTGTSVTVNTSDVTQGYAYSIYNNSSSAITINQGTSVTLRLAGTATTGNRTLAARGFCTIWCVATSPAEAVIAGPGLT